ncbi:MAG: uroporphyrinogen decarboxylase family protein [Thermoguttaceae bacterium]
MTSRELVIRTLNGEPRERVPRDLWLAAELETSQAEALAEINLRFPSDIMQTEIEQPAGKRGRSKGDKADEYVDAWGCGWEANETESLELKSSPLSAKGKIAQFHPPQEILDSSRFTKINKSCENTNRFVLARCQTQLFDRLRWLRGPDTALMDLARGTKDIRTLLKTLHEFCCKEIELLADTEVDGVVLRDDWGTAESLIVSPEMWREIFKPLYREYFKILHEKDKFVFFHSNGYVLDILGDLIKDGVDAVHLQLDLMDLRRLSRRFRGKVCFWGEIVSQELLRSGSVAKVRERVLSVRRALDLGDGGVVAQCKWEADVPLQVIAAAFEPWLAPVGA